MIVKSVLYFLLAGVCEIGTLAAMGTRPGRIMALFVAEGFCMGLFSSLAGAVIGLGVLWVMNMTGVDVAFGRGNQMFTLAPSVAPGEVVSACLIVLGVSILASLQPAAKAARLEPVEALRHV